MKKVTLIFTVVALMISTNLFAQQETDVEGSKDHSLISRFPNSVIVVYTQHEFDEYTLPLGNRPEEGKLFKKLNLEGKVTRIQYAGIPKNRSFLEVYRNYENALKNAGFEILFSGKGEELGSMWPEYIFDDNNSPLPEGNRLPSSNEYSQRYLSAKLARPEGDIYVSLFVTKDSWHEECPLVQLDIIEIKPMESGLVTAVAIDKGIKESGHITLAGIFFDTGIITIKTESDAALKNIAEYLNTNSNNKFYIVGHTDNVGDFTSNMTLSENRAKAVMNELVSEYEVNTNQLKAYGVSSLSPVSSNSSDEGRAKNRRVEIVEQ